MKHAAMICVAMACLGASVPTDLATRAATGVTVSGGRFDLAPLANGESAFLSHPHVWEDVPEILNGWTVTRVDARTCRDAEWRVSVTRGGYVYVAVFAAHVQEFKRGGGWVDTGIEFGFSDRAGSRMTVWRKEARKSIRIPNAQIAILIPPA